MTVTRIEMQDRVRKNIGGVSEADVPSTVIDPVLNRIYQFEIPNRCGGGAIRGVLDFDTVQSFGQYDLDWLSAVQGFVYYGVRASMCLVGGEPIWYSTDPDHFWRIYSASATNQAHPGAVLLDGRIAYLRPIPDKAYAIRFFVSRSRAPFGTGLADDLEAEALIRGAAMYLALDLGMGVAQAKNEIAFERHMSQINGGKYLSDAPGETYDGGF